MGNPYRVLKERGFVSQATEAEGIEKLFDSGRVAAYIGFDPTADSLHAGSLLPLMALSHLRREGHAPIAVLGCGTAMVGDPSGKTEMRKLLSRENIQANGRALERQLRLFIGPEGLLVDNAEWLLPLNYIEFLRDIGRHFSVNRMLSFESYRQRMEKGLSFIEFNYQLLQAYDFLMLFRRHGCRLQMGGDDQWGNIVAGIDLIRRLEAEPAYGLTFPLLQTAGGEKMGKTARGAVWLDAERTSPYEFFQYFRNTDDRDVERFLGFFTFLSMEEVRRLSAAKGAGLNQAKEVLAYEATAIVHGRDNAEKARQAARGAFGAGERTGDIPTSEVTGERLLRGLLAVDIFTEVGLCASKSEARRLISQGGARIGERRLDGLEDMIRPEDFSGGEALLRAGKKRVHRLALKGRGQ